MTPTGTRNPSKRAAAERRLTPRGHWDRQHFNISTYRNGTGRVWCAVRTETLNKCHVHISLQTALWLRRLVTGLSSRRSEFEARWTKWHFDSFLRALWFFSCHHHSANAPSSSTIHLHVTLTTGSNGRSPGNLPINTVIWKIQEH